MENACCNTPSINTLDYFKNKDKDIELYNNNVAQLTNILNDIHAISESPFLFCRENSKNIYPPLQNDFNEQTIYKAFILFCRFDTLKPINESLFSIC